MRALVLTAFHHLAVEERPDPTPGPGEVVIDVVATGICGSDLHGYTGENGRRVPGQIMGHESVGRVAELGPDVEGFAPGTVVTFNPMVLTPADLETYAGREQYCPDKYVIGVRHDYPAAFAEKVVVPAVNLVALPAGVPIEYGALVEPVAVAVHAVRRVVTPETRSALVVGGGPIGQSVVLALLMHEITDITVSEPDPGRRALLERLGAKVLTPGDETVAEQVRADHPTGVDVAIDAVGVTPSLADALTATAMGGAVCLVGMGRPQLQLDAFTVSVEERAIVGSFAYPRQDFIDAAEWIATGPDAVAHLITGEVSLNEAPQAFADLAGGKTAPGKVLVRLDR